MKRLNPLLVVLKLHGLTLPCIRVYTTVYKDGSCCVKFYGARLLGCNLIALQTKLNHLGYTEVTTEVVTSNHKSLVVKATTPQPPQCDARLPLIIEQTLT